MSPNFSENNEENKSSSFSKKYTYTIDNKVLTEQQRDFYEENGYIIIQNLIDNDILDECRQRFIDYCNKKIALKDIFMVKEKSLINTNVEGEYLYNKLHYLSKDVVFQKYICHPNIIKYVECFVGPNISAVNSMVINKPPKAKITSSLHPLHQDLLYSPVRPSERHVGVWTAMEKATVDNGCLFVIPGTHKSELQPHKYLNKDSDISFYGIPGFDLVPKVNLEMEKGDTVFFNILLMHGSWPNTTKGFRKAISSHYASNNCYYIDVAGTNQEQCSKEYVKMANMKGINLNIQELFRSRQLFIKGKPGPLNFKYISSKI